MRQKLIAGNWKMNASSEQVASLLTELLAGLEPNTAQLAVCPPFPYLSQAKQLLADSPVLLGAQDCSDQEAGAFTGQVAATMLADLGINLVLVGHSERRIYQQETAEEILAKTQQALAAGLTPVVCVGETQAERTASKTEERVVEQLDLLFKELSPADLNKLVIAYEPVWAIGTGLTATPAEAQEVHQLIRQNLAKVSPEAATKVRILYGGSMNANNAAELLSMPDIDGGLIGGASLNAADFLTIYQAAGQ